MDSIFDHFKIDKSKLNVDEEYSLYVPRGVLPGNDFLKRIRPFHVGLHMVKDLPLNYMIKSTQTAPKETVKGSDHSLMTFSGPNFASQDYLSLSSNPDSIKASVEALQAYGTHSGGSPMTFGIHKYYKELELTLLKFFEPFGVKFVKIFSTGWQAGYGVIKGLCHEKDHIIIDRLAHNCLWEGAKAATKNIHVCDHLSVDQAEKHLIDIRSKDKENAILVVTESLFSMDSDTPDLKRLQILSKKYNATLLIDSAHDFGVLGDSGRGNIEAQGLTDFSNVIFMGSGSKTLATNIGFIATQHSEINTYLTYLSPSFVFTNAISPAQANTSNFNLKIIMSNEGKKRRDQVLQNCRYLRKTLSENGFKTFGVDSAIVIILIGEEFENRILSKLLLEKGCVVNGVEYPACAKGSARIRLQLQSNHTKEHLDQFIRALKECSPIAKRYYEEAIIYIAEVINKPKL